MVWPILISVSVTPGPYFFSAAATGEIHIRAGSKPGLWRRAAFAADKPKIPARRAKVRRLVLSGRC